MPKAERLSQCFVPLLPITLVFLYLAGLYYHSNILPNNIVAAQATEVALQPETNGGQNVCASNVFPSDMQSACRNALASTIAIGISAEENSTNIFLNCSATVLDESRRNTYIGTADHCDQDLLLREPKTLFYRENNNSPPKSAQIKDYKRDGNTDGFLVLVIETDEDLKAINLAQDDGRPIPEGIRIISVGYPRILKDNGAIQPWASYGISTGKLYFHSSIDVIETRAMTGSGNGQSGGTSVNAKGEYFRPTYFRRARSIWHI